MTTNTTYAHSTASPQPLIATRERRWLGGFGNLFRNENAMWWRTRRWLINVVIWTVLINGMLASVLWTPEQPAADTAPQQPAVGFDANNPVVLGAMVFLLVGGLATATGAIITMQGVILDERKSGTAEWLLSKPASRAAFILSKWTANMLALLLITIVLQGVIAYMLMSARTGSSLPAGPFIAGMSLLALHLLFYLSLTLMLGTLFNGRGAVLAIPLGLLYGAQLLWQLAPWLTRVMPWTLVMPRGETEPALAMLAMQGQPLTSVTPIIATATWIIIFVAVAVWRFGREEF